MANGNRGFRVTTVDPAKADVKDEFYRFRDEADELNHDVVAANGPIHEDGLRRVQCKNCYGAIRMVGHTITVDRTLLKECEAQPLKVR